MILNSLYRLLGRLKGKNWRHNRIYPFDFRVKNTGKQEVQFVYQNQKVTFPKVSKLIHRFAGCNAHVLLSGPSIKTIEDPTRLNHAFCFAVNGSPAFFNEHHLTYDAYVVDDPRYIQQYAEPALQFAAQAQYVFLSYRSIYLLMKQGLNLNGLNIYVFDYRFMPFRQYRPTPIRPFFAHNLTEGLGKSDTIAHIVLQLAHGMAFNHVALFGLDLSMGGRFYNEANPAPQHLHDNWQKGIIEPFLLVRDAVQAGQWSVINCSPNSLLDANILPKCEPNAYLATIKPH